MKLRLTGSRSRLGLGEDGDTSTAGPGRNLLATAECASVPATVSAACPLEKPIKYFLTKKLSIVPVHAAPRAALARNLPQSRLVLLRGVRELRAAHCVLVSLGQHVLAEVIVGQVPFINI